MDELFRNNIYTKPSLSAFKGFELSDEYIEASRARVRRAIKSIPKSLSIGDQ